MKANTLRVSTMSRRMAWYRAGSPPSSATTSWIGWPATPPRALTSLTQTRTPVISSFTAAPTGPLQVPASPSRIGEPPPVGTAAAADPGTADGPGPADATSMTGRWAPELGASTGVGIGEPTFAGVRPGAAEGREEP